mmetsp:Transcript_1653/g.2613  ORF Transcript_1653/g.2613 Transcript_1653/m.2613 type:complete len:165 (-) Transcript_1653:198-692(-)|eukprot:CAMPEP_0185030608 /NCGR_PEP_ID=MMETSP1103-20130426/17584_1 /TAXON_ID=36769 /ORGANISM="Paraphysomonas bandaiensis, Strain Caron Lab Isolate" /LENGTH=164 /DNA_ID=CAMNT_0027565803 /DNA_START=111 /DNA_END=605 /DNA_ORIENTATION=+
MDGHEQWVNDLFEISEYTDAVTGESRCYPTFFPLAVMCPCVLLGQTQSILDNEEGLRYCCFSGLGPTGIFICSSSALLNLCLPAPLSPFLGCCVLCQRGRIMDQFNIEGGLVEVLKGCCCPCGIFQQYQFMRDFHDRKLSDYSVTSSALKRSLLEPRDSGSPII